MLRTFAVFCAVVLLLVGSVEAQVTLTTNLQGHYPFSGNADDLSGNGYHGTVFGATLTSDRFGNANAAYYFDGNDYIHTYTSFDFANRTVSVWVEPDGISSFTERTFIDQNSNALTHGMFKGSFINGNVRMLAGGEDNGFGSADPFFHPSPGAGTWHHVVLVRDGANTRYYVNGYQVGSGTSSSLGSTSFPNIDMVIGVNRSLNAQFFQGKIDDLRVYDRVLSDTEIAQLFYGLDDCVPDTVTVNDTVVVNNGPCDSIVYDTISVFDTISIYDTITIYDTIIVRDTIFLQIKNDGLPPSIQEVKVFPNPFVDQVQVSYGLAESSTVEFRVYDLLGREVQAPIIRNNQIPGSHQETIFIDQAAAGVSQFLLEIRVNGESFAVKLIGH